MDDSIENGMFYIQQLKLVFHYKKDNAIITKLFNYKFPLHIK